MDIAAKQKSRFKLGFTMLELTATAAIIGLLAAVTIMGMSTMNSKVNSAKLTTDVTKLNQLITIYLSTGGSLARLTTAQAVLDKLKTTRTAVDANQEVLPETGRVVDIRLAAQTTNAQASTNAPQAVWDAGTQRFVIASSGSGGVSKFYLNDALASNNYGTETRAQSAVVYNGTPGWVWANASTTMPVKLTPMDASGIDYFTTFNPLPTGTGTGTSGSSSSSSSSSSGWGGGTVTLPTPIINPAGGSFYKAYFPSLLSINPNGAPSSDSSLQYRVNGGAWQLYYGPFPVSQQTTVDAQNITTNTKHYNTSGMDTESYYILVPSFTGAIAAHWNPSTGSSGMTETIDNTNAALVTESNGTVSTRFATGRNVFTFAPMQTFSSVSPNTQFKIGTLSYFNGTVNFGTDATALDLHINLSLSVPVVSTADIDNPLSLTNTVNHFVSATADADYVTLSVPTTNWSITQNGVVYTLQMALANINDANGWVSGTTLYVYEGAKATVDVMGAFVSSP